MTDLPNCKLCGVEMVPRINTKTYTKHFGGNTACPLKGVTFHVDEWIKLMEGWQPIETAPRNDWFLAHSPGGTIHITNWWLCFPKKGQTAPYRKPTHWMHLPQPPESE